MSTLKQPSFQISKNGHQIVCKYPKSPQKYRIFSNTSVFHTLDALFGAKTSFLGQKIVPFSSRLPRSHHSSNPLGHFLATAGGSDHPEHPHLPTSYHIFTEFQTQNSLCTPRNDPKKHRKNDFGNSNGYDKHPFWERWGRGRVPGVRWVLRKCRACIASPLADP